MPRFDSTISVGNLLSIVTVILAMSGAWFAMSNRSQANAEGLSQIRVDIQEIDSRMRAVETRQAVADERFSNILDLLARIDDRLERIEGTR